MEQTPFSSLEEILPPRTDPRCPLVLLLDVSGSMSGAPIKELQNGIQQLKTELENDELAKHRIEISIITFGGNVEVHDFKSVEYFEPPLLIANADTPMAQAILTGLEKLEYRKKEIRNNGWPLYRPWVFLITDGAPTDGYDLWEKAKNTLKEGENNKKFLFYAVGVQSADMSKLSELSSERRPLKLTGLKFSEFFLWLSSSLGNLAKSQPGEKIALPPVSGWTEING